ncbi:MAG: Asp-tRNA(Asn)/Glu-tRNA(Gln) amidotransferase subunit GatC, partial [Puniceicoccales bacterium]|nr:Asp-tRNA(Asn)/Glu-tRNA(Gln) amidotransferase subunit GatC [Puniceicoccales bacterium]
MEDFDIDKIARLARIDLEKEERQQLKRQFATILGYFEKTQQLKVEPIEPTAHVIPTSNVWREDVSTPTLSCHEALMNAPKQRHHQLVVPKVVEQE